MVIKSQNDYVQELMALLPPGAAFPRDPQSVWGQLLNACAAELARIDLRAYQLLQEADPRTAIELLPDWEGFTGLPSICMAGEYQTREQRRAAVVSVLTNKGGQRPADFIALAAQLGFAITITEFRPWTCDSPCDAPMYGMDWAFAMQINTNSVTQSFWTCDSPCDEPLSTWGNQLLQCMIRLYAPAHAIVIVIYS